MVLGSWQHADCRVQIHGQAVIAVVNIYLAKLYPKSVLKHVRSSDLLFRFVLIEIRRRLNTAMLPQVSS